LLEQGWGLKGTLGIVAARDVRDGRLALTGFTVDLSACNLSLEWESN